MDRTARPEVGDELREQLRLALVPGVGPLHRRALLAEFGSAAAVLDASPDRLRQVAGVGPKLSRRIAEARRELDVDQEIATCQEHGVAIVTDQDSRYPRLLREITDPPAVLFVRGELVASDGLSIAIVGTRHATSYGLRQAERLASGLSRSGLTVVSGLARGIDAAAHRGALEAGGRTIAVLGSGVLNVYPSEHGELAARIAATGAVISEFPPRRPPMSGAFPRRNRLITGLCLGVIIVEASDRSGALISATHSMEQGREVFAVPGRVDSRVSRGCHRLIRDGAKLVETVDDVLEELGPLVDVAPRGDGTPVRHPAELLLNDQEQAVLDAIELAPTSIDQIVVASRLPVHRVLATISVLEMRHLVRRVSGNQVCRA